MIRRWLGWMLRWVLRCMLLLVQVGVACGMLLGGCCSVSLLQGTTQHKPTGVRAPYGTYFIAQTKKPGVRGGFRDFTSIRHGPVLSGAW